jgi:hypothetical protein
LPTNRINYSTLAAVFPVFETIKGAFPQTEANGCLDVRIESEFHIYDDETSKRCLIQDNPEGVKHFTVKNDTEQPVCFLAIDKCLLMDSDPIQRCDCAVFDTQTFCFVEIKTVSSVSQRKNLRRKAKNQLKEAIAFFRQNVSFDEMRIEAYIALSTKSESRPMNRASLLEEIEEFDEIGVRLYHDNVKHFTP